MPERISDPLIGYHIEGLVSDDPDDWHSSILVLEVYGHDGSQVEIEIAEPDQLKAISELLSSSSEELYTAKTRGMGALDYDDPNSLPNISPEDFLDDEPGAS